HDAGHPSVQRVPTPTSICVDDGPCGSHLGTFGHRPRSPKLPSPAVHAARLLQAPVPVSGTFAAPFFTQLDLGEGDSLRSPVVAAPHGARSEGCAGDRACPGGA